MKKRSTEKELMDLGHYSAEEYKECLQKLFLVGKYSGIHHDTVKTLETINPESILDVGCGDGALLSAIAERFPNTTCHGIDISKEAIGYAKSSHNVTFSCRDTLEPADVIMATLVCHHMSDEELERFLHEAYQNAKKHVLINDLQRSRAAKALFRLISGPLFSNRLISHDGIVSIERGFTKKELENFLAPYPHEIRWRLPFRWQVLIWKR